jgi:hypothetical protein
MAAARFTTIESGLDPFYWYASVFGALAMLARAAASKSAEISSHRRAVFAVAVATAPQTLVNSNRSSVVVEECRQVRHHFTKFTVHPLHTFKSFIIE